MRSWISAVRSETCWVRAVCAWIGCLYVAVVSRVFRAPSLLLLSARFAAMSKIAPCNPRQQQQEQEQVEQDERVEVEPCLPSPTGLSDRWSFRLEGLRKRRRGSGGAVGVWVVSRA